MLIALADENAGGEATIRAQIDTVNVAKKFLLAHPEACKVIVSHRGTQSGNPNFVHEHGSLNCVVAFLGEACKFAPSHRGTPQSRAAPSLQFQGLVSKSA
jgi:hypothetical protein